MNFIKPEIEYREVRSDEYGKIVSIPTSVYEKLKEDFETAIHLNVIDELNFKKINGIYIRAKSETDAIISAIYCYKKFAVDNHLSEEFELDCDEEYYEEFNEEDDLFGRWQDGTYCYLPILTSSEFTNHHFKSYNPYSMENNFVHKSELPSDVHNPFWSGLSFPIMININGANIDTMQRALQYENRLCILYETASAHPYALPMFTNGDSTDEDIPLGQVQKDFIFEANLEYVSIPKPPIEYLVSIFKELTTQEQYTVAPSVDCEQIITQLIDYRRSKFESVLDIDRIIHKAARYSNGPILDEHAFTRLFVKEKVSMDHSSMEGRALKELNKLIGLTDVKKELLRIVDRMKFAELRKQSGYSNIDHHMAAVFMGNPGTAKTTVARIFGQLLFDSKVLSNNVFVEVSRKDLIGKYVGWTAHKVQEVFEKGKGGTIFIDEAYSLVNKEDGYSDEAFSAIIQNMEDNPNTLVIFAGYTNEMLNFVRNSNPGLRSRLTNIIQFDDYNEQQLLDIFHYHVERAGYELANRAEIDNSLHGFIKKMAHFDNNQMGNGRLMRKLLSTAIGYMAQRTPENINLLQVADIQFACKELFEAESILQQSQVKKLGFHIS